jgi:ABC-type polysaccharide/polyol phosphate export permease
MKSERQSNLWSIIWVLARTDFKLRYEGSILGFLWVILKPLGIFFVLNFVFMNIFKGERTYSVGMFTGLILWNFFSEGTMTGMTSLVVKAHIVKKIYIPRWVIVIASTLNTLLNFSLNLVILALFYVAYGITPGVTYILVALFYCFLIYVIIVGFSLLTAPMFPRLRDLNQIWEVLLVAGFYSAPIIYPIDLLPRSVQTVLYLNPMTFIIVHVKALLINEQFLFIQHGLLFTFLVIVGFLVSTWIFRTTARRVAEYL